MDNPSLQDSTPVSFAPGYQATTSDSGPYPNHQGMSPTLTAAFEERRQDVQGFLQGSRGLGSQLPVGYGAIAGSSLMNGTAAVSSSSGTTPSASATTAAHMGLGAWSKWGGKRECGSRNRTGRDEGSG